MTCGLVDLLMLGAINIVVGMLIERSRVRHDIQAIRQECAAAVCPYTVDWS